MSGVRSMHNWAQGLSALDPGRPTDQICFIEVIKEALFRRLYEGGLSKEALIKRPYQEASIRRPCEGGLIKEALLRMP